MEQRLICRREAAELLGVCTQTISNLIERGVIKGKELNGRTMVDRNTIMALLDDVEQIKAAKTRLADMKMELERQQEQIGEAITYAEKGNNVFALLLRIAKGGGGYILTSIYDAVIATCGLNIREKQVFRLLFTGQDMTNIAERLGITRERVRQIIGKVSQKIKALSEVDDIIKENHRLKAENSILNKALKHDLQAQSQLDCIAKFKEEHKELKPVLDMPIDSMPISQRAKNCLKNGECNTVIDILRYSEEELLKFRYMGRKSISEISYFLESYGLKAYMPYYGSKIFQTAQTDL